MTAIRKSLPFFFMLFFSVILSDAQQIQWSAPVGGDNQMKYLKIIGSDESNFYVLLSNLPFGTDRNSMGFKSRKNRLACYSLNMVLKWDKPLAPPVPDGKVLDVLSVNGRLLVSAYAASKDHVIRLVLQYLNPDGSYSGLPVIADQFNALKLDDDSKPDLLVSKDESLVAMAYRKINKDEQNQVFRIAVCDSTLQTLYQKEIRVDAGKKRFQPVELLLSDSGNVYLLGLHFTTDKKVKAPGESFYGLYAWLRNEDQVVSYEIKGGGKFLTDAGMAADNLNNAAVISGFYSDQTTYSTAGVFYYAARFSSPGPSEVKTSPFSDEFLKKFMSGRKENNKELVNYSIDALYLRRDGGAVLTAESYNTFSRSYYDYYTQMLISNTYYNYGSIITLSVNTDGSLLWSDVLNKDQNSMDDDGYLSSYCSAVYGSKMYFIYNKYIESKTSVMLSSVASHGEQKTMILFNQVENILAIPKSARQIDADVMLLPAYKDNQLCIARINF